MPPKEVTERVVWCDGGSGPEGHPRVYINVVNIILKNNHTFISYQYYVLLNSLLPLFQDKPGNHACGYCGLRFVKKDHH